MVGRTAEIESLKRAEASNRSEFVAVYGRRRIGKTFLVRETFSQRITFAHTGVENVNQAGQLRAFQSSLRENGWSGNCRLRDWFDAFDALKEIIKSSNQPKKIIFIDELPWIDTPKSNFIPALEFFWNGWASARKDILLVICGSATSWIITKLLKSRGGLHNRVTEQIWLRPFTLAECEEYACELGLQMSRMELAKAYMALGGVPYYWGFLKPGLSLAQNMDALFFASDAKLRLEFSQLFASLFKNPEPYVRIVNTLGAQSIGLTREDLIAACKLKESGKLSKMLEELEQCGFIRRYQAFGAKKKGFICQLIDNYTLFHFRFIRENHAHDPHFWSSSFSTPLHNTWAGLAFERLGLQHVDAIKQALGISGVTCSACTWRSSPDGNTHGVQIDLLIDCDDRVINLCEMKFCEGMFNVDVQCDESLRRKREVFVQKTGTRKAVHLTLITTNGLAGTKYRGVFQSVITLNDLFRPNFT